MEFTARGTIARPRQTVWDVITDISTWTHWDDETKSIEPKGPGPMGPGSEYTMKVGVLDSRTIQVREFTKGQRFSYSASTTGGTYTMMFDLAEATEAGTNVTLTLSMDDAFAKFTGALFGGTQERSIWATVGGLQRYCESLAS